MLFRTDEGMKKGIEIWPENKVQKIRLLQEGSGEGLSRAAELSLEAGAEGEGAIGSRLFRIV